MSNRRCSGEDESINAILMQQHMFLTSNVRTLVICTHCKFDVVSSLVCFSRKYHLAVRTILFLFLFDADMFVQGCEKSRAVVLQIFTRIEFHFYKRPGNYEGMNQPPLSWWERHLHNIGCRCIISANTRPCQLLLIQCCYLR